MSQRSALLFALAGVLAIVPAPAATGRAPGQVVVGLQGNWKDLETWTHFLEASRENELGLGLQPSGDGGTMLIAFTGRLSTRSPQIPPREIAVQIVAPQRANPNLLRSPTLRFVLEDAAAKRTTLDFSRRLLVDNLAAGAPIEQGVARISAGEYRSLAGAAALEANLVGFDVGFRPDQLEAMRARGSRLHLPSP
jgi:hypothetical protein